jgi:hypothetical protein
MIEWWSEISKRAQSTTFTQPGNGSLDAISRSGSVMRTSSVIAPKSPEPQHTEGPSPPYVAQEVPVAAPAPAAVAVAAAHPESTTAPASPVLELLHTGSSSSLTHVEPVAAVAPAPAPEPTAP